MSNFKKMVEARMAKTWEGWQSASRHVRGQIEPTAVPEPTQARAQSESESPILVIPPSLPPDERTAERRAREYMHARTIAFWGSHEQHTGGEPVQFGSGVLLQAAGQKFIVTAEHVVDQFMRHQVYVTVGAGRDGVIHFDKAHIQWSKGGDVAFIALSDAMLAKFSPEKRFTLLSEVSSSDPTHQVGGLYCVYGYPSATSSVDHDARTMTHIAHAASGAPFGPSKRPIDGFDPSIHVAIQYDHAATPDPQGMSGGGLWRVRQAGTRSWTEDDIKLVGIYHTRALFETAPGKVEHALCGTRIGYVLGMLKKYDPGLERAFSLMFPVRGTSVPSRMVID